MMNYNEHMVVEKWKDTSIDEIKDFKKNAKKISIMNTEWIMFYAFLMIFVAAPATVLITRGFGRDFEFFVGMFIVYFGVWKFYIKDRVINKDLGKLAKYAVEEMDIVMKYRK